MSPAVAAAMYIRLKSKDKNEAKREKEEMITRMNLLAADKMATVKLKNIARTKIIGVNNQLPMYVSPLQLQYNLQNYPALVSVKSKEIMSSKTQMSKMYPHLTSSTQRDISAYEDYHHYYTIYD